MSGRRVRQPSVRPGSPRWSQTAADIDDGEGVYAPSRLDPLVRSASPVIGGPAGRRLASAGGFWRAGTVLVVLSAVVFGLGIVQKQHCRADGWSSPDQFWHACYSDIPVVYASSGLGGAERLGLTASLGSGGGLGQSPLAGLMMWVTSGLIDGDAAGANRSFFDLTALLLAALLAVAVAATAFTLGRRGWDASHLALSPVIVTAGLISYQLLAVALVAVALFALSRSRALAGGLLLGLGIAAAPQVAVIALVVAVLSLWRSHSYDPESDSEEAAIEAGRDPRALAGVTFAGSAVIAWLLVRVVLLPGVSGQLGTTWDAWRQGSPGYGSLWLVPQLLGASEPDPASSWGGRAAQLFFGWLFGADALSGTATSVLVVIAMIVVTALLLRLTVARVAPLAPIGTARTGDDDQTFTGLPSSKPSSALSSTMADWVIRRVAPASLAALAFLLVISKSLPAQASLLLLPLMALTGLRWRDHLIWAATEAVYFVGIWLYIAAETTSNRGLPAQFYLIMLLARLAGITWVGIQGILVYGGSQAVDESFRDQAVPTGSIGIEEISSPGLDEGTLRGDREAGTPHSLG
ncbi:hypothetical protein [Kineosporia sp. NBRC 101731]|uniref:hypothetical protein n=1 Tax=Kineosporia sp. NBRC 101731 TaxID=3032199 RepID=UPI0024A0AEB2|nr:hypothetical protein [Kineosporia sp. NBRC 101731]GLY26902.1 hypothetical protein Kisp02_02670 [Kineosporia sp. NBRC 101731]